MNPRLRCPHWSLFARARRLVPILVVLMSFAGAEAALAAVSVSRAQVSGSALRLEGTAIANRDITVDGAVFGRSDGGGKVRIDRSPFTSPADCTVDVNDGSATARVATLSGCTVSSPPPPPMSSGPAAPAPTAPADGASVTTPLTLSWSTVSDVSGINGYNWQLSASPAFSTLVRQDSTLPQTPRSEVGGLSPGTYYWRVQAVNGALVQGAWSQTRSFVVTGNGPTAIGAPVLDPLPFGTQYHPMESFPFSWTPVPGAASYVVEYSRDPGFPAPADRFDNIPVPHYGFTFHRTLIGSWNLRVYAVDANGVQGAPSNVRTFSIAYDAPVGPAPVLVSPANGASLELPITLDWDDVPNPQDLGYEVQVASDSGFANREPLPARTASTMTLLSLSPGVKFWRVRAFRGDNSPTTSAPTAWSEVRSFTVTSAPPKVASITLTRSSAFSGEELQGEIQLTGAAPPGGAVIELTSTHPTATQLPASVTLDAGIAQTTFLFRTGQVTEPTDVTITATYGSSTATFPVTVNPPSLKQLQPSTASVTGGSPSFPFIALNGSAPAGGAVVSLTSNSPLARPPATATVPEGSFFHPITIETSPVDADTTVTITASWKGKVVLYDLVLKPGVPPDSLTVSPTSVTGATLVDGRVAIAAPATQDVQINLSSSHPDVAQVPPSVTITTNGVAVGFLIRTSAVTTPTVVTITASGAGVTRTATLTVNPTPPAPLAAPTLVAPANAGRITAGQTATFDWSDVSGAASYRIQVSSSNTFSTTVLDRVVTPSQLAAALTATGDRFWRVRANDGAGNPGSWSAVRTLRVK
ncbi:MAG: hypothetical protein QOG70_2521 [Solirubrobacteraceae bacterium]|nr:hypothetical protein [Solirubrobacteraceae bacterium]